MLALMDGVPAQVASTIVDVARLMNSDALLMTGGASHWHQPIEGNPNRRRETASVDNMLLFHCAAAVKTFGDIVRAGPDGYQQHSDAFLESVTRLEDFARESFEPGDFVVHGSPTKGFVMERR